MKNHIFAVMLILLICNICNAEETKTVENGANFVQISDRIDTSGQPPRQILEKFSEKSYSLVINLAPPQSPGSVADEGGLVASAGVRYVNIPVDWNAPTIKDFDFFSNVLGGPGADKVLVHCQVNMRASLFTFLYRVVHEKTDPELAHEKLSAVWVPHDQWQEFAQKVLDKHQIDYTLF